MGLRDTPINQTLTEGTVCKPPRVTVSRAGKLVMSVCLAVKRPRLLPIKIGKDGRLEDDFPYFVLEGDAVKQLADRVRVGDRLEIHGCITTRNVDERRATFTPEMRERLRVLLNAIVTSGGLLPVPADLQAARDLLDQLAQPPETRRVVTEIMATSLRLVRSEPENGGVLVASRMMMLEPGAAPSSRKNPPRLGGGHKKKKNKSKRRVVFETTGAHISVSLGAQGEREAPARPTREASTETPTGESASIPSSEGQGFPLGPKGPTNV